MAVGVEEVIGSGNMAVGGVAEVVAGVAGVTVCVEDVPDSGSVAVGGGVAKGGSVAVCVEDVPDSGGVAVGGGVAKGESVTVCVEDVADSGGVAVGGRTIVGVGVVDGRSMADSGWPGGEGKRRLGCSLGHVLRCSATPSLSSSAPHRY